MTVRVGLIGCGYWGRNLLRNFLATPGCEVVAVAEADADCRALAAEDHGDVRFLAIAGELIDDPAVEAVVLATPISTHYALASRALRAGKHVLVEKPLAQTEAEARELVALAQQAGVVLMVDHTFVYSGAVEAIRRVIADGLLGDLLYVDSTRASFGSFQPDADVLQDLAPHDFSIFDYVVPGRLTSLTASGVAPSGPDGPLPTSHAYVNATLEGGASVRLALSWMAPEKIRRMVICGTRRMLVYDDTDRERPVRLLDWHADLVSRGDRLRVAAARGDEFETVMVDGGEPLAAMAADFVASVRDGRAPRADGQAGLRVARLIDAARTSLQAGGAPVGLGLEVGPETPQGAAAHAFS